VNKPNLPLASGEFSVATGVALVTAFAAVVCESRPLIIIVSHSPPFRIMAVSPITGIIQYNSVSQITCTRSCDLLVVV